MAVQLFLKARTQEDNPLTIPFLFINIKYERNYWRKKMSIERVKKYFSEYGMENKILEFDVSSATVELAAAALNCEPCRIAKTLSFMVDGSPI